MKSLTEITIGMISCYYPLNDTIYISDLNSLIHEYLHAVLIKIGEHEASLMLDNLTCRHSHPYDPDCFACNKLYDFDYATHGIGPQNKLTNNKFIEKQIESMKKRLETMKQVVKCLEVGLENLKTVYKVSIQFEKLMAKQEVYLKLLKR